MLSSYFRIRTLNPSGTVNLLFVQKQDNYVTLYLAQFPNGISNERLSIYANGQLINEAQFRTNLPPYLVAKHGFYYASFYPLALEDQYLNGPNGINNQGTYYNLSPESGNVGIMFVGYGNWNTYGSLFVAQGLPSPFTTNKQIVLSDNFGKMVYNKTECTEVNTCYYCDESQKCPNGSVCVYENSVYSCKPIDCESSNSLGFAYSASSPTDFTKTPCAPPKLFESPVISPIVKFNKQAVCSSDSLCGSKLPNGETCPGTCTSGTCVKGQNGWYCKSEMVWPYVIIAIIVILIFVLIVFISIVAYKNHQKTTFVF
jgi:hypothetical protein